MRNQLLESTAMQQIYCDNWGYVSWIDDVRARSDIYERSD